MLSEHDLAFDCGNLQIKDVKNVLRKIREIRRDYIAKHIEDEIQEYLKRTTYGNEEEYIKIRKTLPGKFTLGNLQETRHDLVEEWHPTLNGSLLPEHFSLKSGMYVCQWHNKIPR